MAQVILTGISPTEDAELVRQKLARLFKTTPDRVKQMLDQGAYVFTTVRLKVEQNQLLSVACLQGSGLIALKGA